MKNKEKIALYALSTGLDSALKNALSASYDVTSRALGDASLPDGFFEDLSLLITTEDHEKNTPLWPGLPILSIAKNTSLRLGDLCRQIDQTIKDPALYIDDFNIQHVLFAVGKKPYTYPMGM